MIRYKLYCISCKYSFDSWFSSSCEFERLKKKRLLNCHLCNSSKIKKTIMAPNVLSLKTRKENKIKMNNSQKIKKRILEFQNFIKNNFEDVGNDFAYKARSIHYNHKKNSKGIYGTASKKQIRELQEEGIDTQVFPWIEDKKN